MGIRFSGEFTELCGSYRFAFCRPNWKKYPKSGCPGHTFWIKVGTEFAKYADAALTLKDFPSPANYKVISVRDAAAHAVVDAEGEDRTTKWIASYARSHQLIPILKVEQLELPKGGLCFRGKFDFNGEYRWLDLAGKFPDSRKAEQA